VGDLDLKRRDRLHELLVDVRLRLRRSRSSPEVGDDFETNTAASPRSSTGKSVLVRDDEEL